uniref:hypothetical protein n=1 Tax=Paractinoplanes polyasparticus TaxID=2856853 RepID=UPI001C862A00|nr:hypothetical protein [Actinoplanes polyasparticus]
MRTRPVTYRELLRTSRLGGIVDGSGRRTIDAEVIRRCCTTGAPQVDPRGIRLRGIRVLGQLDLAGTSVEFPLRFESCAFEAAPILENAQVSSLLIVDSPGLPGLLANGLQVRGDLDLSRSAVTGAHRTSASTSKRAAIWLCEANVGGRLLCVDTTITTAGERSLQADRMQVGSTVRRSPAGSTSATLGSVVSSWSGTPRSPPPRPCRSPVRTEASAPPAARSTLPASAWVAN